VEDIITQAIGVAVIINILGDVIIFHGMGISLTLDGVIIPVGR
jgi:hypothetical protein